MALISKAEDGRDAVRGREIDDVEASDIVPGHVCSFWDMRGPEGELGSTGTTFPGADTMGGERNSLFF